MRLQEAACPVTPGAAGAVTDAPLPDDHAADPGGAVVQGEYRCRSRSSMSDIRRRSILYGKICADRRALTSRHYAGGGRQRQYRKISPLHWPKVLLPASAGCTKD